MLIYVCLSSHGFGHAARQATVLCALHRLKPSWRLVVSSNVSADFLKLVCAAVSVEQRFVGWDVGMSYSFRICCLMKSSSNMILTLLLFLC